MEDTCSIRLPVFEGPLDLLLHLIKENKIDIYDIPIALITHQYLEYLKMIKELNLDIAGEFLVMAATLIHIKSRMLLPQDETVEAEEAVDPRLELVQRLLEYQAFKEAALELKEKEDEWLGIFSREPEKEDKENKEDKEELYLFDISIFDLIGVFKKILEKAPPEVITITRDTLTVKDKISMIIEILQESETVRFEDLFQTERTKAHLIITFIALLELLRSGIASVYQEREFGNIWVVSRLETTAYDSSGQ